MLKVESAYSVFLFMIRDTEFFMSIVCFLLPSFYINNSLLTVFKTMSYRTKLINSLGYSVDLLLLLVKL